MSKLVATNVATQVAYTARTNAQGLYTIHRSARLARTRFVPRHKDFRVNETNEIAAGVRTESPSRHHHADRPAGDGRSHRHQPILQTQKAVVGEVVSETTIRGMPLNGRNFSQLALLMPGRRDTPSLTASLNPRTSAQVDRSSTDSANRRTTTPSTAST
jgi:hypothetical protein